MKNAEITLTNGVYSLNRSILGKETSLHTYEEYEKAMTALKAADNSTRFDHDEPVLTPLEEKLDRQMALQRKRVMNDRYIYKRYPPIIPFYAARKQIEKDLNFSIFAQMPKGGNLHIHSSATLNATSFINLLISQPETMRNVYIYLGKDTEKKKKYQLFYFSKKIDSSGYFFPLIEIVQKEGIEWVVQWFTLGNERVEQIDYIWNEFNAIFMRVSPILKTRTVFLLYYEQAFRELSNDHIDLVELRFGPSTLVDNNDDVLMDENAGYGNILDVEFPPLNDTESIQLVLKAYLRAKKDCPDLNLSLILSGSRKKTDKSTEQVIDEAVKDMQKAQEWSKRFIDEDGRSFIIGYDMVSEEDRGYPTDMFAKAVFENKISTPFYFHDGESCWADVDNLFAAYLLGTKRVGHGLNLFRFPEVMKNIVENDIALEICPISNQLLRYTTDLRMHPMGEFIKRGVQCVICSDDPQIFNYTGLSFDFYEVYYALLLDLRAMKKLIKNSYLYSGLPALKKQRKLELFERKWDAFVRKAIDQFVKKDGVK